MLNTCSKRLSLKDVQMLTEICPCFRPGSLNDNETPPPKSARCRPGKGQTWALSTWNPWCWHASQQNHPKLHISAPFWTFGYWIYAEYFWLSTHGMLFTYLHLLNGALRQASRCILAMQLEFQSAQQTWSRHRWALYILSGSQWHLWERSSIARTTYKKQSWCIVHWFNYGLWHIKYI